MNFSKCEHKFMHVPHMIDNNINGFIYLLASIHLYYVKLNERVSSHTHTNYCNLNCFNSIKSVFFAADFCACMVNAVCAHKHTDTQSRVSILNVEYGTFEMVVYLDLFLLLCN